MTNNLREKFSRLSDEIPIVQTDEKMLIAGKNYRMLSKIGFGGFAVVYKALCETDNQLYAVKKINLEFLSPRNLKLAMGEAEKLQQLKSNFIIALRGFFEKNSIFYIVMDYAEGGDLANLIKKQEESQEQFPESTIWKYLSQICQGVSYCHLGGIIHRDLTPRNILMHQGILKLTDFGISKQMTEQAKSSTFTNQWNISYQAPERLLNQPYDTKADIWSLGCILYYLCALRHPFQDDQQEPDKRAILEGTYEEITQSYSDELKELVVEMLNVDPMNRPDADSILKRVQEALEMYDI